MHEKLEKKYAKAEDVVFFHVQTVFEGFDANTPERGPREAKGKGIEAPVGYDGRADGERVSSIMTQYGTGGTPWTIVIDKKGVVRHNAVTPTADTLTKLIDKVRKGR